ncbi:MULTISPECIES: hypothetical protein [Legionella]|uniref:Uncharacterized protein n=1 Tax=Legionella maceachernii TaxID=466 RepID=A0A0W0W2A0_9GAMM|nr:hypothetical protein [Legionella maceachernii]KTD26038.1 hypothetical protein Lmac_1809 [Legionella maceachernii]SJZ51360.1 hypothetical protein SAMN02745128_00321 [Legionella maceachernii]SUP03687.1 Uncharacterised protein [Legionella maceachernii]
MGKISYSQARNHLKAACEQYIAHNQVQLDGLISIDPWSLGLPFTPPRLGFHNWIYSVCWEVHKNLTFNNQEMCNSSTEKILPVLNKEQRLEQSDRSNVLHNLQALIELSHLILDQRGLGQRADCPQLSNLPQENAPFSTKIHYSFEHLLNLSRFMSNQPELQETHMPLIHDYLITIYSSFAGYVKGIAVRELQSTLQSDLGDKEAVEAVEMQLNNKVTLGILRENRQSSWEQNLKLLSVISMLIGVGIFTTLGLACKRYYDSGGTSINFFKPLSENLCETMIQITENTHPHMP